MSWPAIKFYQAISPTGLFSDGDWVESKDQDPNGSVRLIQLADIGIGEFVDKSNRFMTEDAAKRLRCTYLEAGDILVARMPDPIGRACIFPRNMRKCVTVVDVCIVRPDSSQIDNRWLMHLINSGTFRNQINKHVTGTTRQRISRGNLAKLEIPLPPLTKQKRIAAILNKADTIRRKRQQAIQLADEFLRAVFLDMFGDPVTNSKRWETKTLEEFIEQKSDLVDGPFGSSINTQIDYIDDGDIPVIRTKNVSSNGEFVSEDLKFVSREKYESVIRSQVLPGDIILTKVGTIGNVCIFPEIFQEAVLSTTGSCRIRVNKKLVEKTYFYYFLRFYKPKMLEIASAGVQPFLNMKHIKSFFVPSPPMELQKKFAFMASKSSALKWKLGQSSGNSLFEAISQKAFVGGL